MIRTWCKDHPIQFMACYLVFYLAFFKLLEQGIQVPDLVLHCRLDDLIPFCKYAIIPYYLWFAWIPCTLFYLLWFNDRREFWRLCLPLFTGMTLSLLFCAIVPNGTDLRPAYIYGNDIFTRTVRALWRTDTPTNVFPSIHVFNSVTLALAYHHCARLRGRKWLWVRVSADLLCVSIILSTMLLKQHSVFDVMGGIILAFDAYRVKGAGREQETWHNLHVIYTREAETADMFIERATHELAKNHRVRVVSSDGAEQIIILGNGALRVSARAFEREVRAVEAEIREFLDQ